MNKKALKPILITAAILVVLVAGYFLMDLIPDPAVTDPTPTPVKTSNESISLYTQDYYSLKKIELEFNDGSAFDINVKETDNGRLYELNPAIAGWEYNQETLRATAFNAISVTALAKVAEGVTDFSQYELDDPTLIARTFYETDAGEVEHEIQIGKLTSLGDSYYAVMKGEDTVYAVSKFIVQNLMTTELQYRQMNFFPSYLSEDQTSIEAAGSITYIRIRNAANNQDMELTYRTDDDLSDLPIGSSRYYMTKPMQSDCNDSTIESNLVNVAAAIKISAVIEDNPADLSKYGLDKPLDIWLRNTDGKEIHYLIGSGNGTTAYAMVEGTNTVLIAENVSPALADLNYIDYMMKLVWIHSIDKVKTIVFDMKGEKSLLDIRENTKDDAGKVVSFKALLDGRPVEEANARRLFSRMLGMMILGDLDQNIDITTAKADYTFTVTMTDGTVNELKLYPLNERQYAPSVNGAEPTFYINVSDIRNLEDGFKAIAAGEEIPR